MERIDNSKYYRRVIHISAEDSPNIRYARAQIEAGLEPDGTEIVPGVIGWELYQQRRKLWDKVRQCIGLDGQFFEDSSTLMFPPLWLNRAERLALLIRDRPRIARGLGIDPAEGGDRTSFCVVDELGIIELQSLKTPNTNSVIDLTLDYINRYKINDHRRVVFDRGGGGKQHADRLRANGFNVRSVGFGESPSIDPKHGMTQVKQKMDTKEKKYAYVNLRVEMYDALRNLIDPGNDNRDYDNESAYQELKDQLKLQGNIQGFAIPHDIPRLREQLALIPFYYDSESRMRLPPKNKRTANSKEQCLIDIIGHSPDEADSLVLAIHAMRTYNINRSVAGVA